MTIVGEGYGRAVDFSQELGVEVQGSAVPREESAPRGQPQDVVELKDAIDF